MSPWAGNEHRIISMIPQCPPNRQDLTVEQMRALRSVDPCTSNFVWRERPGSKSWNARYAGKIGDYVDLRSGVRYVKINGWRCRADELWFSYYGARWNLDQIRRWDDRDFLRWDRYHERWGPLIDAVARSG